MLIGKTLNQKYKIIKHIGKDVRNDRSNIDLVEDISLPDKAYRIVKQFSVRAFTSFKPVELSEVKKLFEAKIKDLSTLGEHDRIPDCYSYFEEEGIFYLVYEFIEGHSLAEELQPGKPWSEEQAVKLLQEVLEILSFAHSRNIIHFNIRPDNIVRCQQDNKLVLTNFHVLEEELCNRTSSIRPITITQIGHFVSYLPHEQAKVKQSDIYAVGIIGIQALTGWQPLSIMMQKIQQPGYLDRYLNVSFQLKSVLKQMIDSDYKQRFSDATEALKALENLNIKTSTKNKLRSNWLKFFNWKR